MMELSGGVVWNVAGENNELLESLKARAVVDSYVDASWMTGCQDGSKDLGAGAAARLPEKGGGDGGAVLVACGFAELVGAVVCVVLLLWACMCRGGAIGEVVRCRACCCSFIVVLRVAFLL